ncbi:MAG: hypothetical protein MUE45_03285 [Methanoregulaceae archaeon]|nr:hypothetical protein [Methanoregulaceae archaeon]MCU0628503.1 hypothetical protein [Methanoregulaceae archaeon]
MAGSRHSFFFSLSALATINAAGCLSMTGDPPARSQDVLWPLSPGTGNGRSAIAIAVNPDDISTPYPEAREWFIRGL